MLGCLKIFLIPIIQNTIGFMIEFTGKQIIVAQITISDGYLVINMAEIYTMFTGNQHNMLLAVMISNWDITETFECFVELISPKSLLDLFSFLTKITCIIIIAADDSV